MTEASRADRRLQQLADGRPLAAADDVVGQHHREGLVADGVAGRVNGVPQPELLVLPHKDELRLIPHATHRRRERRLAPTLQQLLKLRRGIEVVGHGVLAL